MANTNKTLAQLITSIQTEMQLDPGLISDEERTDFINDCIADLGGIGGFETSVAIELTGGVATLPADFVSAIAVIRNDKVLHPTSFRDKRDGFIISYDRIEVFPHEDETVTLWYCYMPAPLEESTDRPNIPNGFDVAIRDYAVARAHRKNGNIGLYREYMAAYEAKKYELSQRLTQLENSRITNIINSEEPAELPSIQNEEILF